MVRPAEKIMGIVPADSKYVIEAKISPLDIDETFTGQGVRISFPSLPRDQELYLYSQILAFQLIHMKTNVMVNLTIKQL